MAKKQLVPTRKEVRDYDKFANEAVFEAEFLALVMEHPHTSNHVRRALHYILIASCNVLLERLKDYNGDGQMFRDIYPHAAVYNAPGMFKAYQIILSEMEKDRGGRRVLDSIEKTTTEGRLPPRYPHPLKEHFQKYRKAWVMAGADADPHAVPEGGAR